MDYGLYMRKERQYARGETKNKEQGGESSLRVCMGIHMCYMSASSLGYCTVSVWVHVCVESMAVKRR